MRPKHEPRISFSLPPPTPRFTSPLPILVLLCLKSLPSCPHCAASITSCLCSCGGLLQNCSALILPSQACQAWSSYDRLDHGCLKPFSGSPTLQKKKKLKPLTMDETLLHPFLAHLQVHEAELLLLSFPYSSPSFTWLTQPSSSNSTQSSPPHPCPKASSDLPSGLPENLLPQ